MAYTPPPNHYPPVIFNEGSQRWELTQPWHIWFLNLGRNLGLEQTATGSLDSRLTTAEADIDALEAALPSAGKIHFIIPVHSVSNATLTLTNQAAALQWLANNNRNIVRADLTDATEIRLLVRVVTISAVGTARIFAGYNTAYSLTAAAYTEPAGLSVPLTALGMVASAWITIPPAMKADIFIGLFQIGGDGVADPAISHTYLEVRG